MAGIAAALNLTPIVKVLVGLAAIAFTLFILYLIGIFLLRAISGVLTHLSGGDDEFGAIIVFWGGAAIVVVLVILGFTNGIIAFE